MQAKRKSGSKSANETGFHVGVFNLAVQIELERQEEMAARRRALASGCDPMKDIGVATSGSRGIGARSFRRWDERRGAFVTMYFDAMQERWLELDVRPVWKVALEAARVRIAARRAAKATAAQEVPQ